MQARFMRLLHTKRYKPITSNVIGPRELTHKLYNSLEFLASVFKRTLGPYGMNTIIEDSYLHHLITKDGFTVYSKVVLYERLPRTIARLFLKIAGSLNETVGDGTTSAIIIAKELYGIHTLLKKYKIPPQTLIHILEAVVTVINDFITRCYAKPLNISKEPGVFTPCPQFKEIISNIASISLNNDYNFGNLIGEVFAAMKNPGMGFIHVELSKNRETTYELDRGFEISRGLLLPEMVTEADGRRAIYENPHILTIKGHLLTNDIPGLKVAIDTIIGTLKKPLVIIAGGFSQIVTETIRQSLITYAEQRGTQMPLMCVEIDTESSLGKEGLLDLQANIGSRIITVEQGKNFPAEANPLQYLSYCGTCEKIIANITTYTRIIRGKRDEAKVQFRIEEIDKTLEAMKSEQHVDNSHRIFLLHRRKAALLNDMITISVGGDTLEEKENRQYLFDDAVRGCKSAIRNGYVCGGNTLIPKICDWLIETDHRDSLSVVMVTTTKFNLDANGVSLKKAYLIILDILRYIKAAYTNAYAHILNNKFHNWRISHRIAKRCINQLSVYNLVSNTYEQDSMISESKVINSSEVDSQILTAAISILKLIITSNQFIRIPEAEQMKKNL
jgi:chaperonin GroEL (HSP60 family)